MKKHVSKNGAPLPDTPFRELPELLKKSGVRLGVRPDPPPLPRRPSHRRSCPPNRTRRCSVMRWTG